MLSSTLLLCLSAASTAGNQFSFTIWDWEPAYRNVEYFKHQVDTCAGYGVNTIELGVSWRDCEPTDNNFDSSSRRTRCLRSSNPHCPRQRHRWQNGSSPAFPFRRLYLRLRRPPHGSANNREHQLRFAAAVARHYAGKGFTYTPAFSVHMEVKFGGWNTYEPSARAGFRNWLAGRYTSIGALNETWIASFASFGDIDPPVPQNTNGGPSTDAASADWIRLREATLTDWVSAFAAAVRKHDPAARISVPLGESFRAESAAFANLAYWNYSRPADEIVHSYDFFMHGPGHIDDVALATAIMTGIAQRPTVIEIDGPILIEKYGYTPKHRVTAASRALGNGAVGVQVTNWGSADLAAQPWIGAIGAAIQAPREQRQNRPPILYYASKWQNYSVRDPNLDLFDTQFRALGFCSM